MSGDAGSAVEERVVGAQGSGAAERRTLGSAGGASQAGPAQRWPWEGLPWVASVWPHWSPSLTLPVHLATLPSRAGDRPHPASEHALGLLGPGEEGGSTAVLVEAGATPSLPVSWWQ